MFWVLNRDVISGPSKCTFMKITRLWNIREPCNNAGPKIHKNQGHLVLVCQNSILEQRIVIFIHSFQHYEIKTWRDKVSTFKIATFMDILVLSIMNILNISVNFLKEIHFQPKLLWLHFAKCLKFWTLRHHLAFSWKTLAIKV